MSGSDEIHDLLRTFLRDPAASFAIGVVGASAEFSRDPDEALVVDEPDSLTLATARGAIRLEASADLRPAAYEAPSQHPGRWQQGLAFCARRKAADLKSRVGLVALGPDEAAIRPEDRDGLLFDLGIGARTMAFHVRTDDAELGEMLRLYNGRTVFESGNPVLPALMKANPPRVIASAFGRIEVFQPIGHEKTPEGPHSHLFPERLASRRTHPEEVLVPPGWLPVFFVYPESPFFDAVGREHPFKAEAHRRFQDLMTRWGDPGYRTEKDRVLRALEGGQDPGSFRPLDAPFAAAALIVALRQAALDPEPVPRLGEWRARFDPEA